MSFNANDVLYYSYYNELFISGGASIELQDIALQKPSWAFYFLLYVKEADIKKCQTVICKDPYYAYSAIENIPNINVQMIIDAVKGTKYEKLVNETIMNKACE